MPKDGTDVWESLPSDTQQRLLHVVAIHRCLPKDSSSEEDEDSDDDYAFADMLSSGSARPAQGSGKRKGQKSGQAGAEPEGLDLREVERLLASRFSVPDAGVDDSLIEEQMEFCETVEGLLLRSGALTLSDLDRGEDSVSAVEESREKRCLNLEEDQDGILAALDGVLSQPHLNYCMFLKGTGRRLGVELSVLETLIRSNLLIVPAAMAFIQELTEVIDSMEPKLRRLGDGSVGLFGSFVALCFSTWPILSCSTDYFACTVRPTPLPMRQPAL